MSKGVKILMPYLLSDILFPPYLLGKVLVGLQNSVSSALRSSGTFQAEFSQVSLG